MAEPYVNIDLEKIEHNARVITRLCAKHGIAVSGVTKVTCGNPFVAEAMQKGGVKSIGESRMKNIQRLKANGINLPFVLLRIPPLSAANEIVTSVNISLNSELSVIAALSESAQKRGLVHDIILMVDLGDLREGFLPGDLFAVTRDVIELEGVRIVGLGSNLSCYGGVVPTEENMGLLAHYAEEMEGRFNLKLRYVSGGNSSSLNLIASGKMPKKINHIRIGEAILLGRETVDRTPVPGAYLDAFLLKSEIIELKKKPSVPIGETAQDAFGNKPEFEDRGDMTRAILCIGREDVDVDGIAPTDPRLSVLGASSDHLLVDVTNAADDIQMGDRLEFSLNYSALLAAMTSDYVEKFSIKHGEAEQEIKGVVFFGIPGETDAINPSAGVAAKLIPGFGRMGIPVVNKGDLPLSFLENKEPARTVSEKKTVILKTAGQVAGQIQHAFADRFLPVAVSSDPSGSMGVYAGLAGVLHPPGLILFSACGGFNCPRDETGLKTYYDMGRMVLASALGYGDQDLAACGGITPKFRPENVVLIGVREIEEHEADLIRKSMIKVFTMEDIDALGMKEVCYRAVREACMGTSGLHITFDMSVIDAKEFPALRHPVIGGITYREAHLAMEILFRSGLIRSVDVTGFSPEADKDYYTAHAVAGFLLSLFGKRILGAGKSRNGCSL